MAKSKVICSFIRNERYCDLTEDWCCYVVPDDSNDTGIAVYNGSERLCSDGTVVPQAHKGDEKNGAE